MSFFQVPLNPHASGPRHALLRELTGQEEALVTQASPLMASELVGRLLVDVWGGASSRPDVWSLGVSDRDRLIAELYLNCYGDRIDATVPCRDCSKSFAIGFSLSELLAGQLPSRPEGVEGPDEQGIYRLAGGCRFRLPTAGDERAAIGLGTGEATLGLLERCLVEGRISSAKQELEQALERLAPLLALKLSAACPHCGTAQQVLFDLVQFFIRALLRERPLLMREVHCLASVYHWSHAEILALPRSERRTYVSLVLAERTPHAEELLS
jgi:hypothetical protein